MVLINENFHPSKNEINNSLEVIIACKTTQCPVKI